MSREARGQKSAAGGEYPSFALNHSVLTLWDMSKKPINNSDLRERMGGAAKTRGAAIIDLDESTGRSLVADGITNKKLRAVSVAPFDPDAFALRMWGDRDDRYASWMPRLTSDAKTPSYDENHRSTMVTDNEDDQSFGWLDDVIRLATAPSGGDLIGEGLQYDQAGFLESLYEEGYGFAEMKRSVVTNTLHRNLGFVADGTRIGQWSQVLCIGEVKGTQAAAGGRQHQHSETLIRADAGIYFGKEGTGRLVHNKQESDPGEENDPIRTVFLKLEGTATKDEHFDNASDANNDVQPLDKSIAKKEIRGWVRIPKPGSGDCHRYDMSYHSNPPPPPPGSSSGSDVPTGGGPTPTATSENPDGTSAQAGVDVDESEGTSTEPPSTEAGEPTQAAGSGYMGVDTDSLINDFVNSTPN